MLVMLFSVKGEVPRISTKNPPFMTQNACRSVLFVHLFHKRTEINSHNQKGAVE